MKGLQRPPKALFKAPNAVTSTPELISPSSMATQKRGVAASGAVDWRLALRFRPQEKAFWFTSGVSHRGPYSTQTSLIHVYLMIMHD
jgi:hypothetical protein